MAECVGWGWRRGRALWDQMLALAEFTSHWVSGPPSRGFRNSLWCKLTVPGSLRKYHHWQILGRASDYPTQLLAVGSS